MILVISLLETNSDRLCVKRIMRSLPLSILKENLAVVYNRYKKIYNE